LTEKNIDFSIALEGIPVDDATLLKMHQALLNQIAEKESIYRSTSCHSNKNNYLHFTIARLAYGFAKEEYESVVEEMKKRGLAVS
jgi:hypothetical protein